MWLEVGIGLDIGLDIGLGNSFRNAEPHVQQHKPSPMTYRRWLWLVLAVLH